MRTSNIAVLPTISVRLAAALTVVELGMGTMLSHKQRNRWCTVVSAHLGEQIDVEISNNNSFHLMHA